MKYLIKGNNEQDKRELYNYLKQLKNTEYVVEIKEVKNNRSLNQNNYYWKCIVQVLSKELGYFNDEIHGILKTKFLSEYITIENKDNKIGVLKTNSTARLNTKQFELFTEQVRIWAISELGIKLPLPNEYIYVED